MNIFKEVWEGFRPYLLKLSIDFLVPGAMWLFLFAFHGLTKLLPIHGWAGQFILGLHSAGTVVALGIFLFFAVNDIIHIHKGDIATCLA